MNHRQHVNLVVVVHQLDRGIPRHCESSLLLYRFASERSSQSVSLMRIAAFDSAGLFRRQWTRMDRYCRKRGGDCLCPYAPATGCGRASVLMHVEQRAVFFVTASLPIGLLLRLRHSAVMSDMATRLVMDAVAKPRCLTPHMIVSQALI